MKQACETASMFVVDDIKKQTPSARLPQLSKLTASRTKQLCDTSKVACRAGGLIPMRLPIFSLRMLKLLLLPRKSDAGSYEVLYLSRISISTNLNLQICCSKTQPSQEISARISEQLWFSSLTLLFHLSILSDV
jgi:hypothetical protein